MFRRTPPTWLAPPLLDLLILGKLCPYDILPFALIKGRFPSRPLLIILPHHPHFSHHCLSLRPHIRQVAHVLVRKQPSPPIQIVGLVGALSKVPVIGVRGFLAVGLVPPLASADRAPVHHSLVLVSVVLSGIGVGVRSDFGAGGEAEGPARAHERNEVVVADRAAAHELIAVVAAVLRGLELGIVEAAGIHAILERFSDDRQTQGEGLEDVHRRSWDIWDSPKPFLHRGLLLRRRVARFSLGRLLDACSAVS